MLDDDDDRYTDDMGEMDGLDESTLVRGADLNRPRPDPTDITLLFEIGIKEELALPIMARAEALGLKPTEYMRRIVLAHAGVEAADAAGDEAPAPAPEAPAQDAPDAA